MPMDAELDVIVERWDELRESGQAAAAEELCRDHPDRLAEVRGLLRKLGCLDQFIGEIPSGATMDQVTLSAEAAALPKNVSTQLRCRAVRLHARGGLGEVFVAWDEELRREVALKLIQHPYDRDPDRRERFVREAEITGRLGHPGIVPVFGIGETDDGRPCYAMRFIEGETFRQQSCGSMLWKQRATATHANMTWPYAGCSPA